jgi:hypothetical protein
MQFQYHYEKLHGNAGEVIRSMFAQLQALGRVGHQSSRAEFFEEGRWEKTGLIYNL